MAIDPTAILGADSSQYTPDVLQRRQLIAQKLYMDAAKTRPYRTWLEGVGDLANTGVYAAAMKQGNDLESGGQKAIAQALMGGGSPQVGPPSGGIGPQSAMPQVSNGAPDSFAGNIDQGGQAAASPDLASRVKKFEGYNPKAYSDFKQYSIGYGTKANSPNEVIDQPEAERRLGTELGKSQVLVNQFAPNAPPGVKDALSSLTYNAGPSWMQGGLGKAVQAGDWDRAKAGLLQYNRAGGEVNPGLVARRQQEAQWFNQTPPQPNSPGGGLPGGDPQLAAGPQAPVQIASLGNDMPVPGAPPVPGRDTLTPQDQSIAPPGANNPAIAAALGQQGATGAVPPPQPDRAAIAGALNPQAPPQNVPQPPVQMAQGVPPQAQGLPPQGVPQGQPQGQQPIDPRSVAQQMLQNPNPYVRQQGIEMMQKIMSTPQQFVGTGQYDAMGHEKKGFLDPYARTINGQPVGQGGNASSNDLQPTYDATGHDEAYLKSLPLETQSAVKAITEGKLNPSGRNLQQLLPLASRYENGFTQQDYNTKLRTQNDYDSGPSSKITKSINTTVDHGWKLLNSIDKLGNNETLPAANPAINAVRGQYDKQYQDARSGAALNAELFIKELDYATTGGHPTVSGQEALRKDFNVDGSPVAQKAFVRKGLEMLDSRLQSHAEGYNRGMKSMKDPTSFLDDKNKSHFEQMLGQQAPQEQTGSAAAPAAPQGAGAPVKVSSPDEAMKLPKGTQFIDPDGNVRIRP